MNFLNSYVQYASEITDAPVEFHDFTGLAILSAAIGNKVHFEFADPPCEVVWEQSHGDKLNVEFVGSEATLSGFWEFEVTEGEADLSPTGPEEIHLERSDSHSGNWLGCVATRRRRDR